MYILYMWGFFCVVVGFLVAFSPISVSWMLIELKRHIKKRKQKGRTLMLLKVGKRKSTKMVFLDMVMSQSLRKVRWPF